MLNLATETFLKAPPGGGREGAVDMRIHHKNELNLDIFARRFHGNYHHQFLTLRVLSFLMFCRCALTDADIDLAPSTRHTQILTLVGCAYLDLSTCIFETLPASFIFNYIDTSVDWLLSFCGNNCWFLAHGQHVVLEGPAYFEMLLIINSMHECTQLVLITSGQKTYRMAKWRWLNVYKLRTVKLQLGDLVMIPELYHFS